MCLAIPLKLVEINGLDGVGERDGISRKIRLDFIKDAALGDYVICHAGFAIEKMAAAAAEANMAAAAEVEEALREIEIADKR
ncbi:MAG TPA: HypC/HybG/HupF family hydrogenase formation chaperone [Bacillota bacterium]|nr:HypC/HybG/HupF family hydrogenase formation chaperone [Bacillota bacterium]HQC35961.1 HypC/HybG/HupF family hydrogenase formation chaperone [Bacillota bacterium]